MGNNIYKNLFLVLLFLIAHNLVYAQINVGGIPYKIEFPNNNYAQKQPIVVTPLDIELLEKEDNQQVIGEYRVAVRENINIKFPNGGVFTNLPNGKKLWSAELIYPNAKAVDVVLKDYNIGGNTKIFFINNNGKQIEGAFDAKSNNEDKIFASPTIQGDRVNIELEFSNTEDLEKTSFEIETFHGHYRGYFATRLHTMYGDDVSIGTDVVTGLANDCHINASCPSASAYTIARKSAVHIYTGTGYCSGNMINNTAQNCLPLLMTASHCEKSNSKLSSKFATWRFYFNYEIPTCENKNTASAVKTDYITGAELLARSDFPTNMGLNPPMKGDFLLLKLKDLFNIATGNFGATLIGWDRTFTPTIGNSYVMFAHPAGDAKKFTKYKKITANGDFNGGGINTHWAASLELGGSEGGSSGAALIVANTNRMIGDLSGGPSTYGPCNTDENNVSLFSKFSLNWEYLNGGDGTSKTRLKDHLDPAGLNPNFLNAASKASTSAPCTPLSVINNNISNEFFVYPNPAKDQLTVRFNQYINNDVVINITDITGKLIETINLTNTKNELKINLGKYAEGIYLLMLNDGNNFGQQKFCVIK